MLGEPNQTAVRYCKANTVQKFPTTVFPTKCTTSAGNIMFQRISREIVRRGNMYEVFIKVTRGELFKTYAGR
jgi:hypothetical protein